MTALYMDGFDHYGTGLSGTLNMQDGVWAEVNQNGGQGFTIDSPDWGPARTGANCLSLRTTNQSAVARLVIPTAPKKMFMSFGYARNVLPSTLSVMFVINDHTNTSKLSVVVNSTGTISVYSGLIGSLLATTSGPVIRSQTWHFIETCIDYNTGAFTLRVDDSAADQAPVLTASIGTADENSQLVFYSPGSVESGRPWYIDDLFIRDSTGSVNNSWLGDRRVATLNAQEDTTTAGWTPRYYHEYGAGVCRFANMQTNNPNPVNPSASFYAASATSLNTGANDFTWETSVRFEALPTASGYSTLVSRWDALNNKRSYRFVLGGSSFNNGSIQFDYSTDGTSAVTPLVFPWSPSLNQWYHIALVRASNELLLFIDGIQQGLPISCTDTFFAATSVYSTGCEVTDNNIQGIIPVADTYFTGMFDETRFTNGFARYTTSFTPTGPFPRGSGSDAEWAFVQFLAGYDAIIQDESAAARGLNLIHGVSQFTVNDGPAVGAFSTISKIVPDDNTFISAALTSATGTLTMTIQPTAGDTVTVGTTDGTTPAVYTFRATVPSAYDVLIDTSAQATLLNLISAINAGSGVGTKYGTGTIANFDVVASQLPTGQMMVTALTAGTVGNTIPTTATGTAATWADTTLDGGADIPGPSDFKVQRPPPNTTIISAIQQTVRAYKSDSGICVMQNALIGPLGGVATGVTHNLSTSPDYYWDIIEEDPDTSAPITPTTIINGKLRINRTS